MPPSGGEPMETDAGLEGLDDTNSSLPVGPFTFTITRLRQMEQQLAAETDAALSVSSSIAGSAAASRAQRRQVAAAMSQRTSKYKGVNLHSRSCRWDAHFWDKRQVHLGCFDFEIQAAVAYDMAALKVKGPEAHTNFSVTNYLQELQLLDTMSFPEVVASLRASRRHLLTNLRLTHAAAAGIPISTTRPKPAVPPLPGMPPQRQPADQARTIKRASSTKRSPTLQATDSHHSTDTRQQGPAHDDHAATPSHHPSHHPAGYPTLAYFANHLPPGYHMTAPGHPPAPHPAYHTVLAAGPPTGPPGAPQGSHPVIVCYAPPPYATTSGPMHLDAPPGQHPYGPPPGAPPGAIHYVIHAPGEAPTALASSYPPSMRINHHHHPASSAPSHPQLRHPAAAPNTYPPERPASPTTSSSSAAHDPAHPPASPPRPSSATSNDNSPPHLNSIYSASDSLLLHAGRIRAKRLQDNDPPYPTSTKRKPTPPPTDPSPSRYPTSRSDTTTATATYPHLKVHTNPLKRTSPKAAPSRSPPATPHEPPFVILPALRPPPGALPPGTASAPAPKSTHAPHPNPAMPFYASHPHAPPHPHPHPPGQLIAISTGNGQYILTSPQDSTPLPGHPGAPTIVHASWGTHPAGAAPYPPPGSLSHMHHHQHHPQMMAAMYDSRQELRPLGAPGYPQVIVIDSATGQAVHHPPATAYVHGDRLRSAAGVGAL